MTLRLQLLITIYLGTVAVPTIGTGQDQAVVPLSQAHAHNDYYHDRPLLDALDHGFCSVEADVFVDGDKLLVGHSRDELDASRTLERLYLQPLLDRVQRNNGRVYRNGPEFTLLIDFKSAAGPTYAALVPLLQKFESMLVRHVNGERKEGAVQIIISGNRPFDAIRAASPRLAYIDGRLSDLGHAEWASWMPLISDRWPSHFRWQGRGEIPDDDLMRLRASLHQAHESGQRVRFWATPDEVSMWRLLANEGVDLINTDDLPGLAQFLRDRSSTP